MLQDIPSPTQEDTFKLDREAVVSPAMEDTLRLELGAAVRRLAVGVDVFDRFELKKRLGRGGMAVVWLAWDRWHRQEVALKFLPEEISLDDLSKSQLHEEAGRCKQLTHDHIVRIYDSHGDDNYVAIAMEVASGGSLNALRANRPHRCFEVSEIEEWMVQLCEALSYSHERAGIIHRDLKPANLLLDNRGWLKVSDFGLAHKIQQSMARLTNAQRKPDIAGTKPYMSPQQWAGEMPAPSDDLYAVGCTIFALLTGEEPFPRGPISQLAASVFPSTLAQRRLELGIDGEPIPAHWEDAVAACLAKSPWDRPSCAAALLEMLRPRGALRSTPSRWPAPWVALKQAASPLRPLFAEDSTSPAGTKNSRRRKPWRLPAMKKLRSWGKLPVVLAVLALGTYAALRWLPERFQRDAKHLIQQSAERLKASTAHVSSPTSAPPSQRTAEPPVIVDAQKSDDTRRSLLWLLSAQMLSTAGRGYADTASLDLAETREIASLLPANHRWVAPLRTGELTLGDAYEHPVVLSRVRDVPRPSAPTLIALRTRGITPDLPIPAIWSSTAARALGDAEWNALAEALRPFLSAEAAREPLARVHLGLQAYWGLGQKEDKTAALVSFRQARAAGSALGSYWTGLCLKNGQGTTADGTQALACFQEAAARGCPSGWLGAGMLYEEGRLLPRDEGKALACYTRAASEHDANALLRVGYAYLFGIGDKADMGKALDCYREAASQGLPEALFAMGKLHWDGLGVDQDFAKACEYYEKSAAKGFASAFYGLGVAYAGGQGVPQDLARAKTLYERAASKRNAVAAYSLGQMYEAGQGVPRNDSTAREYYQMALNLGLRKAQEALYRLPASASARPRNVSAKAASGSELPYGKPAPGKPGFCISPYAPAGGYMDVRGYPRGTQVRCPWTQKIFLLP